MRAHPSYSVVQGAGCQALWSLSGNENNKVTIAAGGGIDGVIADMQTHATSNADVKKFGDLVLRRFGHQPSLPTIK
jgi:hypothetical protein